jgi:hypothetical protein
LQDFSAAFRANQRQQDQIAFHQKTPPGQDIQSAAADGRLPFA